jgi:diguanylate cyclase (GGDEF)-like protein/PAS domain S-box-containing protein
MNISGITNAYFSLTKLKQATPRNWRFEWSHAPDFPLGGVMSAPDKFSSPLKNETPSTPEHALAELVQKMERREHVLSITLASLTDFAYIFDREGRFLFANEPLLNLWDLTLEQVEGRNFFDLGYPAELALRLHHQLREVIENKASFIGEESYTSPTGVHGVYEYIFSPVIAANGSAVEFVVGSTRDVTERRRTEDKLRDSQKHLRDIIDGLGPTMFVGLLTPQGILIEVNRSPLEAAGLVAEDVLGKPFVDTHWWSHSVEVQEQLRDAIQRAALGEPSRYEVRTLGGNGQHIDIDFSLQPVKNDGGEVIFLVPSASVITERKLAEEALLKSEAKFRTLAEVIPQMVWTTTASGANTYFNQQWMDYTGLALEESLGDGWNKPFHPEDRQRAWDAWQQAVVTGETYTNECRLRRKDGIYRWWLMRGVPMRDAAGAIEKWFGTCTDIHDIKMAEQEIFRNNAALLDSEVKIKRLNRVYSILSQINMLIVRVSDSEELFREACRIAVEQGSFRMAMINIVDQSTGEIYPVASAGKEETLLADIRALLGSPAAERSMTVRAMRGKEIIVSNNVEDDPQVLLGPDYYRAGVRSIAVIPLIVSGEAVGVLALYADETDFFHEAEMRLLTELTSDISFALDHIEKQDRLHYLAYYDSLTGLANRSLFLERVEQHMQRAIDGGFGLGIGIIDIERFKNINDSLGQPAGDALLKQVASWFEANLGGPDFLARIDADHFAVVLPQIIEDRNIVRLIEKKLTAFMEHSFNLNGAAFQIAYKTGIAIFPNDGATAETLYKNAEAALKKAKAGGDPYLFFTQKMTAMVAAKLALENQMRQAIKNNEFVLHYQPKFDLASGKLTGAEALIRWNDPQTGLVAPGEFIPILEETGLIYEVGRWALRQAADDHLRWRAAGLPAVRIAVNVSPLQLRNRGFINEIRQVIGNDARAADALELEITESVIMSDVEHSATILQAVRAMGLSVAIDDFGTGFSSLSYLSKLPVDTLKIDRSFVIDMNGRPEGLALVSTIITLAHSLKLKVVAEGVETEDQAQLLRLLKCDQVQGFLYSKPLPTDLFEQKFLAAPARRT